MGRYGQQFHPAFWIHPRIKGSLMTVNVKNNSTSTRTHEHHKTQQTRQDLKTPERITNIEMVPPCFAGEVTVVYSAGDFHSHLFQWMGLGNSVVPGSDCRMVLGFH
jgi:hypothetical protein